MPINLTAPVNVYRPGIPGAPVDMAVNSTQQAMFAVICAAPASLLRCPGAKDAYQRPRLDLADLSRRWDSRNVFSTDSGLYGWRVGAGGRQNRFATLVGRCSPMACQSRRYRGAIRMAPSRRMTSPLSIAFSTMWTVSCPYSSGLPNRLGWGT